MDLSEGLNGMLNELEGIEEEVESEITDCSDMEEELLRLEQMNKEREQQEKQQEIKENISGISKVLAYMYKEGPTGYINPKDIAFLHPFTKGIESAWSILQEQTAEQLKRVAEEMKEPHWKRLNKQKPVKQRIKQAISEKTKTLPEKYEDRSFILAVTKDFCYRTGTRILIKRTEKTPKRDTHLDKTYEKLQGFFSPVKTYNWEDEKITEFIKCMFSD